MKIASLFRSFMICALPLWGLCAGGCASEKEYPGGDPNGEVDVELNVSVLMPTADATRAAAPSFSAPDYPAEALNSLRVLILDKESSKVQHNRMVLFVNGIPQSDDMIFRLKASSQYVVYLLGNCRDMDYDYGIDRYPVGSTYSSADEGGIESRVLYAGSEGWLFNNADKDKSRVDIPLMEKFELATLPPADGGIRRQHSELFVTRSAAKFSFSIATSPEYRGDSNKKLTSIKISGISDRQFLLPAATLYAPEKDKPGLGVDGGREITSFDLPQNGNVNEFIYHLPEPLSLPTSGYEWNPEIYLPESLLPEGGFLCSLSFDKGESWLEPVVLPNLPYGLPRNTHAKVKVTIGNNNAFFTELTVLPWNRESADFDYTDQIGMIADGALSFASGSYLSLDKTAGRLVIKNQAAAKGSFGLSTPLGVRWDAYLITTGGEPDAIQFRKADDTTTTHLSGIINSSKTDFLIVSTVAPGSVANKAMLQVVVTLADGRGVPVNILQGGGYGTGIENLTIIQNPK